MANQAAFRKGGFFGGSLFGVMKDGLKCGRFFPDQPFLGT